MSETYPGLVMTEQQQCQVKPESIFMPPARRKRDEVYGKGKGFVHYTSADAALKIIDSKRLWMRSTTCMSDYREVQHGFDILLHFFSNEEKKARFLSSLNACFPGVADEAIKMFDDYWRDTKANTYISSISEHEDEEDLHGRLSMWRAFGGNTARVALIFRIPFFSAAGEALNIIFNPVSYMEESKAHAEVETIIQNIQNHKEFICSIGRPAIVQTVFTMLYAAVACLKHPGFHEENEWRVIYGPNRYQTMTPKSITREPRTNTRYTVCRVRLRLFSDKNASLKQS